MVFFVSQLIWDEKRAAKMRQFQTYLPINLKRLKEASLIFGSAVLCLGNTATRPNFSQPPSRIALVHQLFSSRTITD